MPKTSWSFAVPELTAPIGVTRWGHFGMPVVLFASAGNDGLEAERRGVIAALTPLLDSGRIKLYAVDGTAMHVLLAGTATVAERIGAQRAFAQWIESGLVPQVRRDCASDDLQLLACGCALGAASALLALIRSPQLFRGALGLSGTYDLLPWFGPTPGETGDAMEAMQVSALQACSQLSEGPALVKLRERPVTLAATAGDYDDPAATQAMAQRLRERGIATRTDVWGPEFHFGFASWCQMLPHFIGTWL